MSINSYAYQELSQTYTDRTDGSIQFNSNIKNDGKYKALLERLLGDSDQITDTRKSLPAESKVHLLENTEDSIQWGVNKIREAIISCRLLRATSTSKEPSVFDCFKGRPSFHIVCRPNTNYALSEYRKEIQIRYHTEDLFLMGCAVATLDFIYKHKEDEVLYDNLKGSHLAIIRQAISRTPGVKFEELLEDKESLETMIPWLKTFGETEASYEFDERSLPHIERLFEMVGLTLDVLKQRQQCMSYFKFTPELDDISRTQEPFGELILRGENLVSYFSD
jgi:hypothetical protein